MTATVVSILVFLTAVTVLAYPLGAYIEKIMSGRIPRVFAPVERVITRLIGVDPQTQMSGMAYFYNVLAFSAVSLVLTMGTLVLSGIKWDLAFNITASFVSNTNWQSYSGETTLRGWQQAGLLTTQNFVSAAVGIAVLFALIRGLASRSAEKLGNFYTDLVRIVLYILLPLSAALAVLLISQGVVQTLAHGVGATGFDGVERWIPLGPAASQIAIKQLGTNGGGFFGTNSAFPFENPSQITNMLELISIILIPVALCFTYGRAVRAKRQGIAVYSAMMSLMVLAIVGTVIAEYNYQLSGVDTALGNMEGKETRFGAGLSALWAVATTAASNGSVNSMHDSFTPFGGAIPMLLMQLGEVVFGGVGSGLYGMIGFIILTVFIVGLMIGRTPEYLRKKIEPQDMRMAVVLCLTTPVLILVGTAVAVLLPSTPAAVNTGGIHAFSEVLYGFTSGGANNGSAFAGLNANTTFFNTAIGISMLLARFIPIWATLRLADSMRAKPQVAESSGTLRTDTPLFVGILIFMVLLIGALSMFPALALGPIAEGLA